jgi:hypothetical protein
MRAHAHRGITREDFEKMISYLRSRLARNGFAPDDVETIVSTYREYGSLVTS